MSALAEDLGHLLLECPDRLATGRHCAPAPLGQHDELGPAVVGVRTTDDVPQVDQLIDELGHGLRGHVGLARVLVAQEGYTSAYRDITGVTEPTTVLTFRSSGDELLALANGGPRFYRPPWSPTVVGMVLDDHTDWDEVAELVTESYRFCAPQKLRNRMDR